MKRNIEVIEVSCTVLKNLKNLKNTNAQELPICIIQNKIINSNPNYTEHAPKLVLHVNIFVHPRNDIPERHYYFGSLFISLITKLTNFAKENGYNKFFLVGNFDFDQGIDFTENEIVLQTYFRDNGIQYNVLVQFVIRYWSLIEVNQVRFPEFFNTEGYAKFYKHLMVILEKLKEIGEKIKDYNYYNYNSSFSSFNAINGSETSSNSTYFLNYYKSLKNEKEECRLFVKLYTSLIIIQNRIFIIYSGLNLNALDIPEIQMLQSNLFEENYNIDKFIQQLNNYIFIKSIQMRPTFDKLCIDSLENFWKDKLSNSENHILDTMEKLFRSLKPISKQSLIQFVFFNFCDAFLNLINSEFNLVKSFILFAYKKQVNLIRMISITFTKLI